MKKSIDKTDFPATTTLFFSLIKAELEHVQVIICSKQVTKLPEVRFIPWLLFIMAMWRQLSVMPITIIHIWGSFGMYRTM
jgi:hypothetical protein